MADLKSPPPKHDHSPLIFPEGFLWGAGSSAFQVEGNVKDSDWWEWEQTAQPPDFRSGEAADHYHRFKEDFQLAQDLGHNAHRLSLEWSRIEPNEGEFDQTQIDHYREVLKDLKDRGMTVMLTLHHFSNPAWFAHKGGWTSFKSAYYFERFVKRIIPEIEEHVDLWITINEPSVYASLAYLSAEFPPQKRGDYLSFIKVMFNMARSHKKAYKVIHKTAKDAQVGIANPVQSFVALHQHSIREHLAEIMADFFANHLFYFLTGMNCQDFIGLNYYTNWYIGKNKAKFFPSTIDVSEAKTDVSDLGWEIYPDGMFNVIMDFSDHKPIYITENGIASSNDDRRIRFLLSYLKEVYHAIKMGAPVKGYFYWSYTDNMELHRGYEPRFGLVEIDFKTQERTPRPSALIYKDIIKNNGIRHDLMKFLGHRIHADEVIEIPGVGKLKEK